MTIVQELVFPDDGSYGFYQLHEQINSFLLICFSHGSQHELVCAPVTSETYTNSIKKEIDAHLISSAESLRPLKYGLGIIYYEVLDRELIH